MQRRKDGFTIVELVIVIAIIAILAAVLIPTFTSVIGNARKTADVQQMRHINTMLLSGDMQAENLKEQKLQTSNWELAYSKERQEVVIIDNDNTIVAANDESLVGKAAKENGYIKVTELSFPSDNPGDSGDSDGPGGDQDTEQDVWKDVPHWSELTDDERKSVEALYIDDDITNEQFTDKYFEGNTVLKRIYIGKNITEIPRKAFDSCSVLEEVYIAGQNVDINDSAFYGCSSLTKINLDNVSKVGEYAFNCCGLKEVEFAQTLKSIYYDAFNGCALDKLTLPCVAVLPDNEIVIAFSVKHLVIDGGEERSELQVDFVNLIRQIIRAQDDALKVTIGNIKIDENNYKSINPFADMRDGMELYIVDEESFNHLTAAKTKPFGSAKVIKLWEQTT